MIYVEKITNHFADENGNELNDVVESGKTLNTDQGDFREGVKIQVVTKNGVVYEGILEKVSSLAGSSKKDLVILDEFGVKHSIKYDLIENIEDMTAIEEEDDAEL